MGRRRAVLLTALSLTGCSDDVWYRAAPTAGGWIIARADPEDDSCTLLYVSKSSPGEFDTPVTGIDVKLQDAEFANVSRVEGSTGAAGCTTDFYYGAEPIGTEGSGVVRFSDISFVDGRQVACKVKVNAEIEGVKFHETMRIWDEDCPTPAVGGEKKRRYRSVTAHMLWDTLRIMAWDSETNTCAWMHFDVYGSEPTAPVITPEGWNYSGGRLAHMDDAADCSEAGMSGDYIDYDVALSMEETGSGVLTFLTSDAGEVAGMPAQVPCRLSVELSMEFRDEYHWVPRVVKLVDSDVTVDGACGM